MWFKRPQSRNRNRRPHRRNVLDVKLRSDLVRAARLRLVMLSLFVAGGTVLGLYLMWRVGEVALNAFVYENTDYAVQQIDVRTNGKISPDQLCRWSGVKLGDNLFALDLAAVKRNLELVSAVDTVSVERALPHTLRIRVTERVPVAQVNVPRVENGEIVVSVFQLDANGVVIQRVDPRLCTVPLAQAEPQLPLITGLNAFQMQPGRRLELPQVQAALRLIAAFGGSPMAGLVDLRRLDVSAPGVIVATTGTGGEITFGLDHPALQLRRWREIYDFGLRQQRAIATANLAVVNNVPVRWTLAMSAPAATTPRAVKPLDARRRHV